MEYSVDGTGGKVYTVGSNEYGQLGRNSTSKFLSDVTPLASSDVTDNVVDEKKDIITTVTGIAAGGNNTIIIDAEGNVYNFGDNRHGQFGMGSVGGSKNVAVSNNNFSENGQAIAAGSQKWICNEKKMVMFGRSDIIVTVSWVTYLVKIAVYLFWLDRAQKMFFNYL